jgi:TIR domain
MTPPLGKSVFVSYSHTWETFVRRDLVPVLRAAGAGEVFLDYEHFKPGQTLIGQMDALQDRADITLALLSPEYLTSRYCMHEWDRAVARDPHFTGATVPVMFQSCTPPASITTPVGHTALYANLTDPTVAGEWDGILTAIGAPGLGCPAPHWLRVRRDCEERLRAHDSVNLCVKTPGVAWKALMDSLVKDCRLPLPTVNLESGTTQTREGLLGEILAVLSIIATLPPKPKDCAAFEKQLTNGITQRLAFRHFEIVREREKYYEVQLFRSLKFLQDNRELACLFHSREPLASLVATMPADSRLRGVQVDL